MWAFRFDSAGIFLGPQMNSTERGITAHAVAMKSVARSAAFTLTAITVIAGGAFSAIPASATTPATSVVADGKKPSGDKKPSGENKPEDERKDADGPHADPNRKPAPLSVKQVGNVTVRDFDLGNLEIGPEKNKKSFITPVRGIFVAPSKAKNAPLVLMGHLRSPSCTGEIFAHPCPKGTTEMRYDRGMTYWAQALAEKGYAVIVPDLNPVFINKDQDGYDQRKAWLRVMERARDEVLAADAGKKSIFGQGLKDSIDQAHTALVAHSRSGSYIADAQKAWAKSVAPLRSVMAYAPSPNDGKVDFDFEAPVDPNIPYFSVNGDEDGDVNLMDPKWLTEHVGQKRTASALSAVVPGYGHNYINREFSSRKIDDRKNKDKSLPDAKAHEKLMIEASAMWLDSTLRGKSGQMPLKAGEQPPATIAGVPTSWLMVTNAPKYSFLSGASGSAKALGNGTALACHNYPTVVPPFARAKDACPDIEDGVLENNSRLTRVKLTPAGGARFTIPAAGSKGEPTGVSDVAIHLSPSGSRKDKEKGTAIHVTVRLGNGKVFETDIPATHYALKDRKGKQTNGVYTIKTVRVKLPDWVKDQKITAVDITGGLKNVKGGSVDVRAIDLVHR